MISFVVPAYNEEAALGDTLRAIRAAAEGCLGGERYEVIVADDASTDRTAEIAREQGAMVVSVNRRQIAAVRNAGARASRGDILFFVDADTILPEPTLRAALAAIDRGAVGGGSYVRFGGSVPWWARLYVELFMMVWRPLKLAAGCFVFARREAFDAAGGFDERYFASEEIWLSKALKEQGLFVVVRQPVFTSGRKARLHSLWRFLSLTFVLLIKGPRAWQTREGLDLWYDGQREPATGRSSDR